MTEGKFPSDWIMAVVVPVHRAGDGTNPTLTFIGLPESDGTGR